jgi:hypothetical protein
VAQNGVVFPLIERHARPIAQYLNSIPTPQPLKTVLTTHWNALMAGTVDALMQRPPPAPPPPPPTPDEQARRLQAQIEDLNEQLFREKQRYERLAHLHKSQERAEHDRAETEETCGGECGGKDWLFCPHCGRALSPLGIDRRRHPTLQEIADLRRSGFKWKQISGVFGYTTPVAQSVIRDEKHRWYRRTERELERAHVERGGEKRPPTDWRSDERDAQWKRLHEWEEEIGLRPIWKAQHDFSDDEWLTAALGGTLPGPIASWRDETAFSRVTPVSERTLNCLLRNGVSLPQALEMTDEQILALRNMGKKGLAEIRACAK